MIKLTFNKKFFIKCFWWFVVIIPGIPFILISLGLLIYTHWPRDFSQHTNFKFDDKTQYITLSAHGVKDNNTSWSDQLQHKMSINKPPQLQGVIQQHISLNWTSFSDSVYTCSVVGRKLGNEIGDKITKTSNIEAIHLIGHSCGSFVIFGICESIKSSNKKIEIQTTYLDPVSVYSGIWWDFGIEKFGSCADFSDTYIDTQDRVPGSNQNLPHSFTFDVTNIRIDKKLSHPPHVWPTIFYTDAYSRQQAPLHFKSKIKWHEKLEKSVINEF